MSGYSQVIGHDNTLDGSARDVTIHAAAGEVEINGPFDDWMGFATLASFDDAAAAVELAERIALNPEAELKKLGYDTAGWFDPA